MTYIALRLTQRGPLNDEKIETNVGKPKLSREGKFTAIGIGAIGMVLLTASALDFRLGLPTFICGAVTAAAVLLASRQSPWPVLKDISWSVLPLVAGLFVMVEALIRTGAIAHLSEMLHAAVAQSVARTAWSVGIATAVADNIANNLPVGLVAGSVATSDHLPTEVVGVVLIGVISGRTCR